MSRSTVYLLSAAVVATLAGGALIVLRPDGTGPGRGPVAPEASPTVNAIQAKGAFQDDAMNTIRSFELVGELPPQTVEQHARALESARGQLTAVYYYDSGRSIPGDSLTLAPALAEARAVLYEDPSWGAWRYAFMRAPDGTVRFVDCDRLRGDELCRKGD